MPFATLKIRTQGLSTANQSVRSVAAETVLYLLSYKILYARFLNSNSKFNKSKP